MNATYSPYGSFYSWGTDRIYLGGVYGARSICVFCRNPGAGMNELLTRMDTGGIHHFIHLYKHEKAHRAQRRQGILVVPGAPGDTGDRDGVRDAWEAAHSLDPTWRDTTDAYWDDENNTSVDA